MARIVPQQPSGTVDPKLAKDAQPAVAASRSSPLRYLVGALTSLLFAVLSWMVSRGLVAHFAAHPPHFEQPIAQSIAVALKTLLIGTSLLAFFSCSLIGVGLLLLVVRSLRFDN